jgi:hypothetical protein
MLTKILIKYFIEITGGNYNRLLNYMYNGKNIKNSNVFLIFRTTSDENGTFSIPSLFSTFKLHNQDHTHIVYKDISSIEDMYSFINQIKEQNNQIKGLWIKAHGSSNGFKLGKSQEGKTTYLSNCEGQFENEYAGHKFIKKNSIKIEKILNNLSLNSSIILESCSTGKIDSLGNFSIAQTIATLAPQCTVFAPCQDATFLSTNLKWKNNLLKVKFTDPKTPYNKYFKNIKSIFNKTIYYGSLGYFSTKNITTRYLAYPIKI